MGWGPERRGQVEARCDGPSVEAGPKPQEVHSGQRTDDGALQVGVVAVCPGE